MTHIDPSFFDSFANRGGAQRWADDRGFRLVMDHFRGGYVEGFDRDREYQFWRAGWAEPQMFRLSDQSEYFNVWGLKYRPITPETGEA